MLSWEILSHAWLVAQADVFSKNGYCVPNKIPKILDIFDKIKELKS
jgi:hypothetical protein